MSYLRGNLFNSMLFKATKSFLSSNKKFKDIHQGESCYIFGNGASIKYYDLAEFNDRVSIGCGLLFLHKDFEKLNMPYYYTSHPFFYYPAWTNPYSHSLERNVLGSIYKSNIYQNRDIEYFVSLTNYLGLTGRNINYVYHYDELITNKKCPDLSGKFTFMESALSGMLGIAVYMGFKDIILVGCDYASTPKMQGHFYEYGKWPLRDKQSIYAEKPLAAISEIVSVRTVTINENFTGDLIKEISYKSLKKREVNYSENNKIIKSSSLNALNNTNMHYKIFSEE
jgi:hypothetical protein